jgi:hypothetical protein
MSARAAAATNPSQPPEIGATGSLMEEGRGVRAWRIVRSAAAMPMASSSSTLNCLVGMRPSGDADASWSAGWEDGWRSR